MRRIADSAIVRVAIGEDLDELVQQIWDVASEARWIGTEVPFDRDVRRVGLDALLTGHRPRYWSPTHPLRQAQAF